MATDCYRILDVDLVIESAQEPFLAAFRQDYGRFQAPLPGASNPLRVHFEAGPQGEGAFLAVDDLRHTLEGHPQAWRLAAQTLAQVVQDHLGAYTTLHAATLAQPGGALAIAGPSGAGKTTLALALMAAGWAYYSDDFCPIHRETRLVHSYPRSLWVRPGPGQMASDLTRGKVLFNLEERGFTIGGPPLLLRWLICLDGKAGQENIGKGRLRIGIRKGAEDALLAEFLSVEGTEVERASEPGALGWTVHYLREGDPTRRIKDLLQRHRDLIWNVFSLPDPHPGFTQQPVLSPIPPHDAAFHLLGDLKHDLIEAGRARTMKPGALLAHLSDLLSGVACFRLTPGPLEACLTLIHHELNGVGTP